MAKIQRLGFSKMNLRDPAEHFYHDGRNQLEKGDVDSAIEFFEKALSVRVHFKTLELLGECYLKKSNFEKAITYLSSAVTLNRGVRAASLLATAMYVSGVDKYRADVPEFIDLVLARDPRNRNALSLKSKVASELKETDHHHPTN